MTPGPTSQKGGGWCGDPENCSWNNSSARDWAGLLGWAVGVGGMFDRGDVDNPLRNWNYVYVPYWTGDLDERRSVGRPIPCNDVEILWFKKFHELS